jgi:hypothetical protein
MVPDTVTHGTGGNTGGVKGMVVGSLKSRRTRERVLALTAALSFVGLLLGAPPFCFGETEMPGRNETSAGETFAPSRALPPRWMTFGKVSPLVCAHAIETDGLGWFL